MSSVRIGQAKQGNPPAMASAIERMPRPRRPPGWVLTVSQMIVIVLHCLQIGYDSHPALGTPQLSSDSLEGSSCARVVLLW
jgi:hypothetical protein